MRRLAVLLPLLLLATPADAGRTVALGDGVRAAQLDAGGFALDLRMEMRDDTGSAMDTPVLRILVGGRAVLEVVGEASGFDTPMAEAVVVEADLANEQPEVVFTSYTGGAHCCTRTIAARQTRGSRWEAVEVGTFDGGGADLRDADGDGAAEFLIADQRFLYTFDCYACSAAPLVVLGLSGGVVRDVTADPRFLPAHRAWLAELEANWSGEEPGPGYWAGWVAAKARVGEGRAAFQTLLARQDPARDEGVDLCADGSTDCETYVHLPLAEGLVLFLDKNGFDLR